MTEIKQETKIHSTEVEIAGYLSKTLSGEDRQRIENHMAACDECREKLVSAYESVRIFKKGKVPIMKKINIYLILAIIAFALSFLFPQYFLQFLTATIILGIKWVVDSKSTKMLVMIYEAWKNGGEKEASRVLKNLDSDPKSRF